MPVGQLGRQVPKTWEHVEKYPLRALAAAEQPTGIPVGLGIAWYTSFDTPVKDGLRYWIGRGPLGGYRGGHAIMAKGPKPDAESWHAWYDQNPYGGACVGFMLSRMMSHYNRVRYAGEWLYWEAQKVDYWPGGAYDGASPQYEGTAISSGCDVLRTRGHKMRTWSVERAGHGIAANRWLTSVDEILRTLSLPLATKLGAVPLLNSWGTWYPRVVWMPGETLATLLNQDGEAMVVTDR